MLRAASVATTGARDKIRQLADEMTTLRRNVDMGPVEYRSAGAYILDTYQAGLGDTVAKERLQMFYRTAAHQKTTDNLGVIPDPIIGDVLNFIDAARPLVTFARPAEHAVGDVVSAEGHAARDHCEAGLALVRPPTRRRSWSRRR